MKCINCTSLKTQEKNNATVAKHKTRATSHYHTIHMGELPYTHVEAPRTKGVAI
jgi:hypothetical protein